MKCLIQFTYYIICFCIPIAITEEPWRDGELRKHLLADYDQHVHPTQGKQPINVTLGVTVLQVTQLNLWKEQITVEYWLSVIWTDPRLRYEGKLAVIRIPSDQVWRPDIQVYNSVVAGLNPWRLTYVVVYPSGRVVWIPPLTTTTVCKTDIKKYPHDKHTCDIVLGPWTQDVSMIDLNFEAKDDPKVDISTYREHNMWHLESAEIHVTLRTDHCCKNPFHVVTTSLTLSRRSEYYWQVLIVPCLLTIILTAVIFLLPPASGERINLGSVNLIILIVILMYLGWKLPPSRDSVPNVVYFCGVTAIEVVIAIIVSTYAIAKSRSPQINSPPPLAITILRTPAANFLCLCHHKSPERMDFNPLEVEEQLNFQRDWQLFLLVLDRIFMIVYIIAMVINALICFL